MTVAKAGAKGHPPTVAIAPIKSSEQRKYEKMWAHDAYRAISPGESSASMFLEQAHPMKDSTCIDFGCGTGRGGLMISLLGNMVVTLMDFAENALDPDVRNATVTQPHRISWLQADLTKEIPATAAYGFCCDVMEHIPTEDVDLVLHNIFRSAAHVFFQISGGEDNCGVLEDEELHLTVKSYEWWTKKLRDHNVVIHWSRSAEEGVEEGKEYTPAYQFYCTGWQNQKDITYDGAVNTEVEQVKANIIENAKTEWQMIHPHPLQHTEVMMLCGGPSLNDFTDEIIQQRKDGMPLITTNGTYNWAIEHGLEPSLQLIIDARAFNKRFTRPLVDGCKYILASQCHPETFEGMPQDRTYIMHTGQASELSDILDDLYELWFPVPGGSTVTLRGLCLLRMLGFHKIHMYGFDSCYRDGDHHAYEQAENDYKVNRVLPVTVGGRVFECDPWMFYQAKEWMEMVDLFGEEIDLDVKGDGLIAHIIKTGATLSALEENEE